MSYLLTLVIAIIISVGLIPLITRLAHARKWFDRGGSRKLHTGDTPRLGGIAIAAAFFISLISVIAGAYFFGRRLGPGLSFWVVLAVGAGFHLIGLIDDFKDLKARLKFIIQFALAILVVFVGYRFSAIEVPFAPYRLELGIFGPPLTVIWIIGISNAINLIDGMDGLAGGIAFLGSAVWAVLFFRQGQYLPALVATAAAGATIGFIFYNFPPASIFMGDSGALFLGFLLAVIPLLGGSWQEAQTGLVPAITICLVPILDTIAAILRRWRQRVSFFTADKYHLHHKLLNLGFSTRQVLAIIYGLCALLGATALASLYASPKVSFILMIAGWFACGAFFLVLHFLKEKKVRLFEIKGD